MQPGQPRSKHQEDQQLDCSNGDLLGRRWSYCLEWQSMARRRLNPCLGVAEVGQLGSSFFSPQGQYAGQRQQRRKSERLTVLTGLALLLRSVFPDVEPPHTCAPAQPGIGGAWEACPPDELPFGPGSRRRHGTHCRNRGWRCTRSDGRDLDDCVFQGKVATRSN